MPDPAVDADLLFGVVEEVFAAMTGLAPERSASAERSLKVSEHDLTVLMGLTGARPYTVCLGMDAETIHAVTDAVLRTEAGMTLADADEAEVPELLQGSVEELTNRSLAAVAGRLSTGADDPYDVTPPLCVFGEGASLGGVMAGVACELRSDLGTVLVLFVPEEDGAP